MEPLTHNPSSSSENWNESYYFIFYDKKNNIGGMSRVGFKPNKPEGMTFFFLFLPDGTVAAYNMTDNGDHYPNSIKVGGVEHHYLEEGVWRYTFNGPLVVVNNPEDLPNARVNPSLIKDLLEAKIELEFKGINDTYEYSEFMTPESRELGKKSGDKHWEQIAKVTGTIKLEDNEYIIESAMAQRDHTHGIRDWTGIGNWFYFVVWFNEALAINPAAIVMDDGRLGSGGFLFKDGRNIPLMEITLKEHRFEKGKPYPVVTILELVDAEGNTHILEGTPGPIIPIPFNDAEGRESVLIQSFGEFTLDSIKGGYGSYETLRRI